VPTTLARCSLLAERFDVHGFSNLQLSPEPMVTITLPDGNKRSFDTSVTVLQVAASIGPGLAKAALAGKVNGTEVDTSYLLETDVQLSILTARDPEGLSIIRHSCARLMANADKNL